MSIKKYFSIFIFIITFQSSYSQYTQLSSEAEVSIITAGPGKVLYEGFGHSTIRVFDAQNGIDLAYNYGIFDFDAPNFYLNFTKGKLLYKLQSYPFYIFVNSYKRDKRWIKEQILNLNQTEKQQFYEYLENNAKPENATYFYDPFFNNCASKLRDITDVILKEKISFNTNTEEKKQSFRQLMNIEIPWNSWGSFGINLALGSKLDEIVDEKQAMYLPDYVLSGFSTATINRKGRTENLVKKELTILNYKELKIDPSVLNPLTCFLIVLFIGTFITYRDLKKKQLTKWLDFTLFISTGILGICVLFLWFFTDHSTTPNNFNFLWAFAPNFLFAFFVIKNQKKKWLKYYIKLVVILLLLVPFIWLGQVQQLPLAVIPLLILLLIRYLTLLKLLPSVK